MLVCLIKYSVAKKIGLEIKKEQKSLFGIGNAFQPSAVTLGKSFFELKVDHVKAVINCFIVEDHVLPYDLIIGRNFLDLENIAFGRFGKNLEVWYTDKIPFSELQNEIETNKKIALKSVEPIEIDSNSINLIETKTDELKNGYVIVECLEGCVDSLLEIVEGKTVVPVINLGNQKIKFKENQCVSKVIDINDEWELNDVNNLISNDEEGEAKNSNVCTIYESKRDIVMEEVKFDASLGDEKKIELLSLINEFRDCFALNITELGCTTLTRMDIKEIEGSKPVCLRPYKASLEERNAIKNIVKEWKVNGIVSDTRSPYASPVLLVKKKTGENRLVIDFRRLNSQTVKDKFPLPRIDDLLECLGNCTMFTSLDLAHGYLQVPLTEEAKLKTAFITPDDTGQFERMIFGLANAPSEFQRLMYQVLGPLLNTKALCYLDDILIPAKNWKDMMERTREVFERLRMAKLTLKLTKCEFGKREVEFLGFIINAEGLKPGNRKIKAIENFPTPKNVHDIRKFLGLTSFFRRFVKKYALKAEPLTRLTRKNEEFVWEDDQQQAFESLKENLTTQPILAHYRPDAKTEVHCDASSLGLAGMLLQQGEDNKLHLVYCVSKKTTATENKYHSSKLELMAIVWTLDRLRQFLIGIKFIIVTDCQALIYMNSKKSLNSQIARWYNLIQEYDFEVRHRPGVKMSHVDALSRCPVSEPDDTLTEIIEKKLEVCLTLTEEEQILMIQHSDPDLKKIITIFQKAASDRSTDEKRMIDGYEFKKSRLFRKVTENGKEKLLYVIPKGMRKSVAIKFHDLMGHFAVERTINKIKELYWFPSMKRYIRRHISMCFQCLMNKVPAGKQQGLLNPIKPGRRPFAVIHFDHLGPFVKSSKSNQDILVIIDNFTRFVRLTPVKNTSARYVMKALKEFVNDFGLPERIISDRGSCFTSQMFEKYCTDNGIRHTLNSTKHPQANGMVERTNRTILSTITTCMEDGRQKDWDLKIKEVERNLNNFVNKSTNKTPFEMLHGYSPRFNDGILRALADESSDSWTEPEKLQNEARKSIEISQLKMKEAFDKKKCRTLKFESGEIVVMRTTPKSTGQPTKTQPKYRGPLIITEVLPHDTYRVTQLEEKEKGHFYATTAHVSQLKPWRLHFDDDDVNSDQFTDDDDIEDAEPRRNPMRSIRKNNGK